MGGFIDFSVREDCVNLMDSYGEICVKCNSCGRFDEKTKYACYLEVLKAQQADNANFNDWCEGAEELQRENQAKNAAWFKAKIQEVEALARREGTE